MAKSEEDDHRSILASKAVYADIASRREVPVACGLSELDVHSDGYLNPGIYQITWNDFVTAFGINQKRLELVCGLSSIAEILSRCGCRHLFVGGSLITGKSKPNDFDGCYSVDGLNENQLAQNEPHLLLPEEGSLSRLRQKFGGTVEPIRTLPHLGASMLEILQYDARSKTRKGIVYINLAEFSQG